MSLELCDNIITIIFLSVHEKSLLSFRLTCRQWYDISNNKDILTKLYPEKELTFCEIYIRIAPTFKSIQFGYSECMNLLTKTGCYDSKLRRYYNSEYSIDHDYIHPNLISTHVEYRKQKNELLSQQSVCMQFAQHIFFQLEPKDMLSFRLVCSYFCKVSCKNMLSRMLMFKHYGSYQRLYNNGFVGLYKAITRV